MTFLRHTEAFLADNQHYQNCLKIDASSTRAHWESEISSLISRGFASERVDSITEGAAIPAGTLFMKYNCIITLVGTHEWHFKEIS